MSQFSHGLEGQMQSHSIIYLNGTIRLKSLFQQSKLPQFGGEWTVGGIVHLGKPAPSAILSDPNSNRYCANVSKLSPKYSAGVCVWGGRGRQWH